MIYHDIYHDISQLEQPREILYRSLQKWGDLGYKPQTLMINSLSSRPHQIWSFYRVEILRYPLFLRQEETSATHSIVVCVPLYPIIYIL